MHLGLEWNAVSFAIYGQTCCNELFGGHPTTFAIYIIIHIPHTCPF